VATAAPEGLSRQKELSSFKQDREEAPRTVDRSVRPALAETLNPVTRARWGYFRLLFYGQPETNPLDLDFRVLYALGTPGFDPHRQVFEGVDLAVLFS
jgi:hypothetical protein